MKDLREVLNGPMHTGRWTQNWARRRDGKVRRFMKIFWLLMGVMLVITFFIIGIFLGALILGV